MDRKQSCGLRLRWVISLTIMLSMLALSAILVINAYMGQRDVLLEASRSSAQQFASKLDSETLRLIQPLQSTLRLLVHDPLTTAEQLEQRLQRLPVLIEALRANPVISAVYVGYPDRSFWLVRSLRQPEFRRSVSAAEGAAYLVQSIEVATAERPQRAVWLFLSEQLEVIRQDERPDYVFDPHSRPWYQSALSAQAPILTAPYLFYTTRETGVTLAFKGASGAVIGIDASVQDISSELARLRPEQGYELAVVDRLGRTLAYPEVEKMIVRQAGDIRLATLDELQVPALVQLMSQSSEPGKLVGYAADGREWYGVRVPMLALADESLELLMAVPAEQLLANAHRHGQRMLLWSLAFTLLLLLIGYWLAHWVVKPLDQLSEKVFALTRFDFSGSVQVKSRIVEVRELGAIIQRLVTVVQHFQSISKTLARERRLERMLPDVAEDLKASMQADSCAIYLYDADEHALLLSSVHHQDHVRHHYPDSITVTEPRTSHLVEAVKDALIDADGVMVTPLKGRYKYPAGVMVLSMNGDARVEGDSVSRFLEELAGSAATAIETRQLLEAQEKLLDAIIRLLADAIDAKSPYTSAHCERVPILAEMLVDAACKSQGGRFNTFHMDEQDRYEFRLAAWLHDCGKITTPEHVMDKSTKLETLYNRIHEIRTRFEVLWRDVEIAYLKGVIESGAESQLRERRDRQRRQLQQEFEIVARSNLGSEKLPDDDIAKLHKIASRSWARHFDRRLGLSQAELDRLPNDDERLPAREMLLADRVEHIIPWGDRRPPVEANNPDNIWGFDMPLPEHEANQGELYNLTQVYGTLTAEERFSINNHIVQTIRMLSTLPLPPSLRRIPDIAGNHHERMDGEGYPRRLDAASLTVPERIMALADVFEALTAADRPYKTAKTLSESLRILAFMSRDGHLDPEVFCLFLESGVYLEYARRFLKPEQIDKVDLRQLTLLSRSAKQG
ncbi:HD domain-containing phosphohydrolase [Marinobacterium sp. MBR-109]|jgi:HD-GYP domain-containing protein (c-di-GMP phosphodiesterase class II)|uniref:HD domain-containing phosphohydrolase n=1 Tax=Marinobacterium sp. MBR-109 TaxID=3156462 RepID=UPI00339305E7